MRNAASQDISNPDQRVRELHHRTKNDLQGLAGLLQASSQLHPQAAGPLFQAAARIQALAHVHGLQMQAGSGIPVSALARAIIDHQASLAGAEVAWPADTNAEAPLGQGRPAAILDCDAVSVALVITELVLNALADHKHPGTTVAEHDFSTTLRADIVHDKNRWSLTLRNQGQLPAGFDFAAIGRSMHGLGLAKSLTPRRGAELMVTQDGTYVVARLTLQSPCLVCP
jgi:two-component sensor histidine kinase